MTNTADIEVGSTVAVIGCGGVGLSAINGAAIAGAGRIIAVDIKGSKLNLAKHFGATDVVDASACDPVEAVKELTGGGVEYSFEALGLKQTSEQAFQMLRRSGVATIIGMVPEGQMIEIQAADLIATSGFQGSNMGSNHFPGGHAALCRLLSERQAEARRHDLAAASAGRDQRGL